MLHRVLLAVVNLAAAASPSPEITLTASDNAHHITAHGLPRPPLTATRVTSSPPPATRMPLLSSPPTASPVQFPSELPDCLCCQQTRSAMERYCKSQMPMGDLRLEHFDCASELAMDVTMSIVNGALNTASCVPSCQRNLEALTKEGCGGQMACKSLPFACPACAPPPAPPPPAGTTCVPVTTACCDATMNALEKCTPFRNPFALSLQLTLAPRHWQIATPSIRPVLR